MKKFAWVPVVLTAVLIIVGISIAGTRSFEAVGGPWSISTIAATGAGALIVTRRPKHPIGWMFTGYGLLTGGGYVFLAFATRAQSQIAAGWLDASANALTSSAVILLPAALLRFPDGLLPSSRWRWVSPLVVVAAATGAAASLFNGGWGGDPTQANAVSPLREATAPLGDILSNFFLALMLATMTASALSLIVRFRRSAGVAREQMKWLAASAAFLITALAISFLVDGAISLQEEWLVWLVALAFASVPAAVAIAIVRHQLYDIDRIINKTIVYGLATGAVLAIYVATVFAVSTVAAGGSNNVNVALATLASAAAFRPALRRVQQFVDRRFYRRRFNVQTTIDGFGSRLSQDSNLEHLTADLLGVVTSTMQPDRVQVWLRQAEASG